jgi:hypothetical protein
MVSPFYLLVFVCNKLVVNGDFIWKHLLIFYWSYVIRITTFGSRDQFTVMLISKSVIFVILLQI